MADVKDSEKEDIDFAYDIYKDMDGLLDGMNVARVMRGMRLYPSIERMSKFGVTQKPGEKKFTKEECYPIFSELRKEKKDQGCYEDFVECLKLYDKNENGRMLVGELSHSLLTLGEKLTEAEVDEVFEDCLDEENDDGEIPYDPFLRRMCELDPPIKPQPAQAAKKK